MCSSLRVPRLEIAFHVIGHSARPTSTRSLASLDISVNSQDMICNLHTDLSQQSSRLPHASSTTMPSFRLAAVSLSELMPRVPYTRGVLHHARPARKPAFASPLDPVQPKPTAGTSTPRPTASPSSSTSPAPALTANASTELRDSGLEFHHAPPPSAPTYTTGIIPDVLRWAQGSNDVRRSAQAGAPLVKQKRAGGSEAQHDLGLSQEVIQEISRLRIEDPVKWSRKALCRK